MAHRGNANRAGDRARRSRTNCFRIPSGLPLRAPIAVRRRVGTHALTFLVERPLPGFFHACTLDDICGVLELVPPGDLQRVRLILLNMPTRKQQIFRSVWGRAIYFARWGRWQGPAITLEAQPQDLVIRWGRSVPPECAAELERLRRDGHRVTLERGRWRIETSPAATRNTQLFHTLLHELGHHVDYVRSVLRPSDWWENAALARSLDRAYFARPTREKELFADRYADELGARIGARFPSRFDVAAMRACALDPAWFRPSAGGR